MSKIIEHLDSEKIKIAIEPENLHFLSRIEIFDNIDSTNTYLLNQAKMGAPSGSVCLAEEQTAARGRRGRTWFSARGSNIACSLLWRFSDSSLSGLSIAVAVMVSNALKKYGILNGIQLKWPNDVLFDGRKLAGILLEQSNTGVVIGIGINLYLPSDADSKWISVQEISNNVARNYLVGLILNELLAKLPVYETRGLTGFINEWRQSDAFFNKTITVHTPEKIHVGIMQGINDQGELLLKDEQGNLQQFRYGEVSVRI
jgi:BirA family biotin operon repressor/biotin-[acetyl-CoA-carboxylase] ligase